MCGVAYCISWLQSLDTVLTIVVVSVTSADNKCDRLLFLHTERHSGKVSAWNDVCRRITYAVAPGIATGVADPSHVHTMPPVRLYARSRGKVVAHAPGHPCSHGIPILHGEGLHECVCVGVRSGC